MKQSTEMVLFNVIIHRRYKDDLLNQLSKIHNVHIKARSEEEETLSKKSKEDEKTLEKIKNLRQTSDALFKKLKIREIDFEELKIKEKEKFEAKNIEELINHCLEEINFYFNRVNELERYIAKAKIEFENIIIIKECYEFLESFGINRFSLGYFNHLGFRVFSTFIKNLPILRNLLDFSEFPNVYQTKNISEDRAIFFVIYPKDLEEDLEERIKLIHAEEIHILKKYLLYDKINFIRIEKEINFIENTLSKYELETDRLRNENLVKFAAINEVIENIEEYGWVDRQFEELSSTRLSLNFFAPRNEKLNIDSLLTRKFKEKVSVESTDISKSHPIYKQKHVQTEIEENTQREIEEQQGKNLKDLREETPTIMKNFILFRPFETLVKMYGTPSYSEIDPTPFVAITFPLLFGLMFGDIGHGFCLVIAGFIGAVVLRNKSEAFKNISWIIFYCGWGAILGGFLYGDFFGEHNIFGYALEPIKIGEFTLHDPIGNVDTIFRFVLIIGVIHINLGWIIQFLNYWKHKKRYLAITDSLMKICFLTGGTILLFVWGLDIASWITEPYPILLTVIPGILLILLKPFGKILGVSYLQEESVGTLLGEGSMETFDTFLSVLSNVSSYLRLLALSLAHIALMIAIKAMIELIPGEGILSQTLIVIGLIFGNLIVIVLEGVLVFINNIRLHFYEFFFKFYQGSGTEFFPFYLGNKFSIMIFKVETEKDLISEEIEKEITVKKSKESLNRAINYISTKYL